MTDDITQITTETIIILEISQYTFSDTGGSSACTAIAASMLTYLLEQLSNHNYHNIFNKSNITNTIISGVSCYNTLISSASLNHISVDQLIPMLTQTNNLCHITDDLHGGAIQGMLTDNKTFEKLFEKARLKGRAG